MQYNYNAPYISFIIKIRAICTISASWGTKRPGVCPHYPNLPVTTNSQHRHRVAQKLTCPKGSAVLLGNPARSTSLACPASRGLRVCVQSLRGQVTDPRGLTRGSGPLAAPRCSGLLPRLLGPRVALSPCAHPRKGRINCPWALENCPGPKGSGTHPLSVSLMLKQIPVSTHTGKFAK